MTNASQPSQASGQVGLTAKTPPASLAQTGDVRERTLEDAPSAARFSIGDTVLREPDYRQILLWAEELGMAPEAVLSTLADPGAGDFSLTEDGALVNLVWDFKRLPLIPTTWLSGLLIRTLEFRGQWPDVHTALRPVLPSLRSLKCTWTRLASIDLSLVPRLTTLYCGGNRLGCSI